MAAAVAVMPAAASRWQPGNADDLRDDPAAGGAGGAGYYSDGQGRRRRWRVRLLAGGTCTIGGGIMGQRTDGLLPPTLITSSSPSRSRPHLQRQLRSGRDVRSSPFASRQGYYQMLNTNIWQVPTPGTLDLRQHESKSYPKTSVRAGTNHPSRHRRHVERRHRREHLPHPDQHAAPC